MTKCKHGLTDLTMCLCSWWDVKRTHEMCDAVISLTGEMCTRLLHEMINWYKNAMPYVHF